MYVGSLTRMVSFGLLRRRHSEDLVINSFRERVYDEVEHK